MYSKIILFLASSFLFIGCSNEAPNCSDSDTKDLVIQIAKGEFVKSLGKKSADSLTLSLENIRTKDVNEKVGSFECAADLKMKGPGGSESAPITYTSELANDGDDFYVNVYGL
jgi:hypothetical protein